MLSEALNISSYDVQNILFFTGYIIGLYFILTETLSSDEFKQKEIHEKAGYFLGSFLLAFIPGITIAVLLVIPLYILSFPYDFIKNDILKYETKNEINTKWYNAVSSLEDWCIDRNKTINGDTSKLEYENDTSKNILLCLTSRDKRLSMIDKLTNKKHQYGLQVLDEENQEFSNIPKEAIKYKSRITDDDLKQINESYFRLDPDSDDRAGFYVSNTYKDFIKFTRSERVPGARLSNDGFCYIDDNCFELNYVKNEALFYLHKYCYPSACHLSIDYVEEGNMRYITSYEFKKPRLRSFYERKNISKEYISELKEIESSAKSSIANLAEIYESPNIIEQIDISLDKS